MGVTVYSYVRFHSYGLLLVRLMCSSGSLYNDVASICSHISSYFNPLNIKGWATCQHSSKPKRRRSLSSTWRSVPHHQLATRGNSPQAIISGFSSALLIPSSSSPPPCFLLNDSMLRRLPLSPSLHQLFSHQTRLVLLPRKYPYSSAYFPSLSLPFSVFYPRSIHSLKVLAMAEQTQKPSSHSHKHTNRLAAEHSPYLLQHAHNPVSGGLFFAVSLESLSRGALINGATRG